MLTGFSGQVVFERWSIGLYNVVSYIFFLLVVVVSWICDAKQIFWWSFAVMRMIWWEEWI